MAVAVVQQLGEGEGEERKEEITVGKLSGLSTQCAPVPSLLALTRHCITDCMVLYTLSAQEICKNSFINKK